MSDEERLSGAPAEPEELVGDDDELEYRPRVIPLPSPAVLMGAVFVIAAVLGAIVPTLSGYGPFGWVLITTEQAEVYVLNQSGQTLVVRARLAEPLVIEDGHLDSLKARTGPNQLIVESESGEVLDTQDVELGERSIYTGLGASCVAIIDLTGFYGGREGDLRLVDGLDSERRWAPLESHMVLLPRRAPPQQVVGSIYWVEEMPCDLLHHDDLSYLYTQAEVRLRHRYEQHQELLERARRARQN